MPEFEIVLPGAVARGVCATDASEDVITAAILADVPHANAGEERRLETAQIVYTLSVTPAEAETGPTGPVFELPPSDAGSA